MQKHNSISDKSHSITRNIILAATLGVVLGLLAGPKVAVLGSLGKLIIQLIKAIALPLVFFAIVEGILSTNIPKRSALKLILIVSINAACAITIGLTISNLFDSGRGLHIAELKDSLQVSKPFQALSTKLDFVTVLSGYIPESVLGPFVEGNMVSVVLLAILIGIAARAVATNSKAEKRTGAETFHNLITFCFRVIEQILLWLVQLVPLAVFGVIASTVGEYGFTPFKALLLYVVAALLGLAIQSLVVYSIWIKYYAGIGLRKFWAEARRPVIYALGVNSSLATLPLTLRALDNLKISHASSRLGACVGTNFNNDGVLLYEALAVLFVAQALGMDLPIIQQIGISLICAVTAMGVAGVPEAGIVALSLVLSSTGMSLEVLPILLTVDWLIARARSVTNVLSDMTVSIAIEGRA